jgi:hypothetical protein
LAIGFHSVFLGSPTADNAVVTTSIITPAISHELKLIGLLHGDRAQGQRLIQSAGSADRALHQLLRDRQ